MSNKKLEEIINKYFYNIDALSSEQKLEYETMLKRRIRAVMEVLIEKEEISVMEIIENRDWFGIQELDIFIQSAREKNKIDSMIWLMQLKNEKYGYKQKEYLL